MQVLVAGGHMTEWDLAKLVTENFSLPFLMASSYQISDAAKARLPKELLFKHTLVPLDVFGDLVCVAMPVMLSFDEIAKIQREHSCEIFPYVGLVSENKKVLTDLFKDYPQWVEQDQKRREEDAKKRAAGGNKQAAGDWMSIFDEGDKAIQETMNKKKPSPASSPATQSPPKK